MTINFYNTLHRKKEEFFPMDNKHVKLYTCGPTVYNFAHIGNFRAYIFEDLLKRFLLYKGYKVTQVMNLTDIEDKIINAIRGKNITANEYTQKYKDSFFNDLDTLGIHKAEVFPAATEHIPEMVKMIQVLLNKGIAYKTEDDSVYFKVSAYPEYGKLANLNIEEMQKGNRVENDEYEKEELRDFALWKGYKEEDGNVFWETELGKGRPGWHIECSAMSSKYLGNHFDIHCGGVDNIFPHHENELAQSQAATGEKFVNYWMHCEHLIVDGKKMSKSLNNFYSLQYILDQGYTPEAIRLTLLSTHYKQKLNFTFEKVKTSEKNIRRIKDFYSSLNNFEEHIVPVFEKLISSTHNKFDSFLSDDLNISGAIGTIFNMIKEVNSYLKKGKISKKDVSDIQEFLRKVDTILNVCKYDEVAEGLTDEEIKLIEERSFARKNKNWAESDRIRDIFLEKGIILKDGPNGTIWTKK